MYIHSNDSYHGDAGCILFKCIENSVHVDSDQLASEEPTD